MASTRSTSSPRTCGYCNTAAAVESSAATYSIRSGGVSVTLSKEDALADLAARCRCGNHNDLSNLAGGKVVVAEIRREGHRILRPGVAVKVQHKRRSGTKYDHGHVIECYDDGTVKVHTTNGTDVIGVDWVQAYNAPKAEVAA